MYLRIIAGDWKGRRFKGPGKNHPVRPTTDRAREALFNMIREDVSGSRVLDLFSGTGALGFESLSRGARFVTFVDHHASSLRLIKTNADLLKAQGNYEIVKARVPEELGRLSGPYDLVFLDPPYQSELIEETLPVLLTLALVHDRTLIIVERDRLSSPLKFSHYSVKREHRVGDTVFGFLRPSGEKKES